MADMKISDHESSVLAYMYVGLCACAISTGKYTCTSTLNMLNMLDIRQSHILEITADKL